MWKHLIRVGTAAAFAAVSAAGTTPVDVVLAVAADADAGTVASREILVKIVVVATMRATAAVSLIEEMRRVETRLLRWKIVVAASM
jgi:hypothetical protein